MTDETKEHTIEFTGKEFTISMPLQPSPIKLVVRVNGVRVKDIELSAPCWVDFTHVITEAPKNCFIDVRLEVPAREFQKTTEGDDPVIRHEVNIFKTPEGGYRAKPYTLREP
jgi:hypothetical protein